MVNIVEDCFDNLHEEENDTIFFYHHSTVIEASSFSSSSNENIKSSNSLLFKLSEFSSTPLYKPAYNYNSYNVVAGAIIISPKKDLVLLVKGAKWGPPKGHAKLDESICECARREILEETGMLFDEKVLNEDTECVHIIPGVFLYVLVLENLKWKYTTRDENEISKIKWYGLNKMMSIKRENRNCLTYYVHKYMSERNERSERKE